MRSFKLLLIIALMSMSLPVLAADEVQLENAEPQKDHSSTDLAERPQREAVRMSPSIRQSPPRPDESGKMRRVAPARADSPLQHVPALKDNMPPPRGGEAPDNR